MALLKVATSSIPDENTCQSQILETDVEKGIDDTRPTPLKSLRVEQEVLETKLSNEPNLEDNDPSSPLLSASSTLSKKRSSTSQDICRICHCEAEPDAPLVAPCSCSGSLKYVHQACLQRWVQSSDMRNCELCKYPFIMQTKIKPYKEWEKLNMSAMERRKLACSVTFHAVAFTCVIWSLYVLIDRSAEEYSSGQLQWPFWTKLVVVAIGFTGGVVFMYVQCTMYVSLCRRWRAYNRVILVQNAPGGSSQTSGASIVNELAVTTTIVTNTTAAVTTANSTSSNGSLKLGSSGWKKDKKSPVQSVVTPVMATALPANMRSKVNVTPELLVPEDTCTPLAESSTQSILRRSTNCSEVDDGTAVLLSDTNPSTWRAFRASHHEDVDDQTAPIPLM